MQGLANAIGSIFQPAQTAGGTPTWVKLLTGGLLGSGEVGNILQSHKQNAYQDYILNLIKNPAQLSSMVTSAQRPLDNALVQAVTNQTQAQAAERGLAQAPGIFNTIESQALAPFVQQNQQMAQNQVMAALGLGQNTFAGQRPTDTSALMAQFIKMFQNPSQRVRPIDITGNAQPAGLQFPITPPNIDVGTTNPNWDSIFGTITPPTIATGPTTPNWGTIFGGS